MNIHTSTDDSTHDNFLDAISDAERVLTRALTSIEHHLGPTAPDLKAVQILILLRLPEHPCPATEVAKRGYYGGTNASHNLAVLLRTGYLEKSRDLFDKRVRSIALTQKGQTVREAFRSLPSILVGT